jgi:hypothetical protein
MGGLKKKMPSRSGLSHRRAGLERRSAVQRFYSKDSILAQALEQKNYLLFAVAVFVAG